MIFVVVNSYLALTLAYSYSALQNSSILNTKSFTFKHTIHHFEIQNSSCFTCTTRPCDASNSVSKTSSL